MEEKERNIYFLDYVNNSSIKDIIKQIVEINLYDNQQEEKVIEYERKPIKLFMSTQGGSMLDMFSLYNHIKYSKTPVWIYISGYSFSAGFLILGAAKKRIASKNTLFLAHQASVSLGYSTIQDQKEQVAIIEKMEDNSEKIILNDTKIPKKKLKEIREKKQDWVIDVYEAKKLGVIDEIIE